MNKQLRKIRRKLVTLGQWCSDNFVGAGALLGIFAGNDRSVTGRGGGAELRQHYIHHWHVSCRRLLES